MLLCILRNENDPTTKLLGKLDVTYDLVKRAIQNNAHQRFRLSRYSASSFSEEKDDEGQEKQNPFVPSSEPAKSKKSKTPVLDNFGKDITAMAAQDKLDPVVGREKEIERVSQILSRRKKNNPLLIGEPGVGKSAIAEGLALRIVQKKVSRVLYGKRVISLDLLAW